MKRILKLALILVFILFFVLPCQAQSVTSLNNVSLDISPKTVSSKATWVIGFTMPKDEYIGHFLISLAGFSPDLSNAQLTVSGIPGGTGLLGKSNPSCASNCDDVRYYFSDPREIKAGTKIIFTITNVKNPDQAGEVGINFINLFSSPYPDMNLAFNASDYFVKLTAEDNQEELMPDSVTDENQGKIQEVLINELFYKEGSQTTKLTEIEDESKIDNFTLDFLDKVKVVFKEPIDLSDEEAVHFIANLADYMTFEYLYFWIDHQMMSFFQVPLEITFYDLPYVWEPDILKDDTNVLAEKDLANFRSAIVDDKSQISFIIREAGGYRVIPHFELYIADNQEIKDANNVVTFTGRISDPQAKIMISLNGEELKDLEPKIDSKRGEFSFTLELIEGSNLIDAQAQSEYGEIAKINKIVHYVSPAADFKEAEGLNPIYYIVIGLGFLALILIIAIAYLMKQR